MTRKDAINHTQYWNGDAGLTTSIHPGGYTIERQDQVKTWCGAWVNRIAFFHNGKPVAMESTPAEGWE